MTDETHIEETYQPGTPHLTERELAERLQMHKVTLATWRVKGKGPKFLKVGKAVRYPLAEVERWEQAQLRQNTAVT